MIIYKSLLKEELKNARQKYRRFARQLEAIPKGNLVAKTVKGQVYHYVNVRKEGKVISKYLGKITKAEIKKYEKQALERKKLKAVLRDVGKEVRFLEKTLGKK